MKGLLEDVGSVNSVAVWKRVHNWTYETFDGDAPPEEFGVFESLVRLWSGKKKNGGLPSWADFDFTDFMGWHGSIAVQQVITEPFDLRCRLWGTKLTEILGADNTGKLFSEFGSGYTENDAAYLAELCRSGSIGRSQGRLDWLQKDYKSAAFIDLPLSSDGSTVDYLITALAETVIE